MKFTEESAGSISAELASSLHAIASDAVIWGMPIVSVDAMRTAFQRDAGAQYHDVVFWSKPADWKLQITTPNASALYVYANFNTTRGPVVLDVPAAIGAGLFGSVLDAWQVPVADIGPHGADAGRGGTYLLLPPQFRGEVRAGYIPVQLQTYNAYALLRAIPRSRSPADVEQALALVKRLRIDRIDDRQPQPQRFIDMTGRMFDGIVRFDMTYYERLARMLDEEPVLRRDETFVKRIEAIGIKRGAPFAPQRTVKVLDLAVRDSHAWLMNKAARQGEPFWPNSTWRMPDRAGADTGFTFVRDGELDIYARGVMYFLGCAPPAQLGKATMYLTTFVDGEGKPLSGDASYRLHVPPNVPARQFWAATVYDLETAALVREAPRVELSSYDSALQRNADGSYDLYFGPRAPEGKEPNWIDTSNVGTWFTMFRCYEPTPELFGGTWRLPDLDKL